MVKVSVQCREVQQDTNLWVSSQVEGSGSAIFLMQSVKNPFYGDKQKSIMEHTLI